MRQGQREPVRPRSSPDPISRERTGGGILTEIVPCVFYFFRGTLLSEVVFSIFFSKDRVVRGMLFSVYFFPKVILSEVVPFYFVFCGH